MTSDADGQALEMGHAIIQSLLVEDDSYCSRRYRKVLSKSSGGNQGLGASGKPHYGQT